MAFTDQHQKRPLFIDSNRLPSESVGKLWIEQENVLIKRKTLNIKI